MAWGDFPIASGVARRTLDHRTTDAWQSREDGSGRGVEVHETTGGLEEVS